MPVVQSRTKDVEIRMALDAPRSSAPRLVLSDAMRLTLLGEVELCTVEGRTHRDDITVYKCLGLVVQGLVSAYHMYTKARNLGVGVTAAF